MNFFNGRNWSKTKQNQGKSSSSFSQAFCKSVFYWLIILNGETGRLTEKPKNELEYPELKGKLYNIPCEK